MFRFGNWNASLAVSVRAKGTIPTQNLKDATEDRILNVEDPQVIL